jgi:hypothetical protein
MIPLTQGYRLAGSVIGRKFGKKDEGGKMKDESVKKGCGE